MAGGRIVVGVDGSAPALRALRWAARQAALTGDSLEVLTSWEYPASWSTMMPGVPSEFDPERLAKEILNASVEKVLDPGTAASVKRVVVGGNAPQALIDAAKGADLLVVGDRGYSGFKAAVLGSVSSHVTQHAPCPVVVVRGDLTDEETADGEIEDVAV
ncbi:universal stress protein [Streptomyces sp. NPDC056144]|uniref:universal stress protein n=1 Tax=unclassified Streptomyces TaxID=2593676 RepID=UPI0035DD7B73